MMSQLVVLAPARVRKPRVDFSQNFGPRRYRIRLRLLNVGRLGAQTH